ncbi:hypothetical protein Psi01_44030 [Planobispora siamensis]|uniref:Uncharacterized protein n=1 Tax=Planobispora siamensis TaxID=936338 RepID=A0A8J3SGC2_9ACTN|nr:hypothetical protein Psi01_44030 [Planobispora siamensis]
MACTLPQAMAVLSATEEAGISISVYIGNVAGPLRTVSLPVLQEFLEPYLGPRKLISQIPPIGGAEIINLRRSQAV